jgi:hypothetical protein
MMLPRRPSASGWEPGSDVARRCRLSDTCEGSANVQKILIAEDALGYKIADRHHGKTGLRDIRKNDVAVD